MIKIRITAILAVIALIFGCQKSDIPLYSGVSPTLYFTNSSTVYTFTENLNNVELGADTIDIPVSLSGISEEYDRVFTTSFNLEDTLSTFEEGMLDVIECVVPANEFYGRMRIKINYSSALDDTIYVARINITANENFPEINLLYSTYSFSFGNMFTEPENWSYLDNYFGYYSNSWYQYILQITGLTSLPYKYYKGASQSGISTEEAERWPMTYFEVISYASQVRDSLNRYNELHAEPMTHLDGEYMGEAVKMGTF